MSLRVDDLASWIQTYDWNYFLTVTNRYPRRDSLAFMRDLWDELTSLSNRVWSVDSPIYLPSRAFIACEPHQFSKNLHAHGLIRGGPALYSPQLIEKAMEKRFGWSRVEPCHQTRDIALYCSKYVTKWGTGDNYDYFGLW